MPQGAVWCVAHGAAHTFLFGAMPRGATMPLRLRGTTWSLHRLLHSCVRSAGLWLDVVGRGDRKPGDCHVANGRLPKRALFF